MCDKKERYGIANFLTDLICLIVVILILECCGCNVCRFVGELVGQCVNGYRNETHQTYHDN